MERNCFLVVKIIYYNVSALGHFSYELVARPCYFIGNKMHSEFGNLSFYAKQKINFHLPYLTVHDEESSRTNPNKLVTHNFN